MSYHVFFRGAFIIGVCLSAILLASVPMFLVYAQTGGTVAVCPPCDNKKVPCPPCKTQTGYGICMPPGGPQACKSLGVKQGDGSNDAASGQGAQQMAEAAQKIMEKLSQGGGGGGGKDQQQTNPLGDKDLLAPNSVNDILNGLYGTSSPSSNTAYEELKELLQQKGSSVTQGEIESLLEKVAGTMPLTAANARTNTQALGEERINSGQGSFTSTIAQKFGFGSGSDRSVGSHTTSGTIRNFFSGIFVGERDNAQERTTFFSRFCSSRKWEGSLLENLFSSGFFSVLCEQKKTTLEGGANTATNKKALINCPKRVERGATSTIAWVCPEGTRSGGVGFDTKGAVIGEVKLFPLETMYYELQCSDGSRNACTVVVGAPKVELESSPASVNLGGRARLYWTTEGVATCKLTGLGMSESGISGAAVSPAIYDRAEFVLTCKTSSGEEATDKVIIDVGV